MTERRKLFTVALELFAERGINTVTLTDIADKAGMEMPAVRCLFIDTRTLVRELLNDVTGPLVSAIALSVAGIDDPRAMLKESMRLLDNWMYENPLYVRTVQRCMLDDPGGIAAIYEQSMYPSEFFDRMDLLIEQGQVRAASTCALASFLDSAILFPHFMTGDVRDAIMPGMSREERFEAIWEMIEHGLFG